MAVDEISPAGPKSGQGWLSLITGTVATVIDLALWEPSPTPRPLLHDAHERNGRVLTLRITPVLGPIPARSAVEHVKQPDRSSLPTLLISFPISESGLHVVGDSSPVIEDDEDDEQNYAVPGEVY